MFLNSENEYKLHEFVAHSTQVNCVTIGPLSNQVLATGGEDCKVNIWRVDNAANIWTLGNNKSPIESLCFDMEEQYVVSGALNGSLKVFDLNEGKLARSLRGHAANVTSIHYHPYGEFIATGAIDSSMKVWDVRSKSCIQTYTGHEKEITCVRFSPDGRWVASAAKDGQLMLWDIIAGKLLQTIKTTPYYITSFEFNPKDLSLAAATTARVVKFWDLETFECIGTTGAESNGVRAITYGGDGNILCMATAEQLKLSSWDPASTRAVAQIGWEKIYDVKASGNYNQLIAASFNANFASIYAVDLERLMPELASINDNNDDDSLGYAPQEEVKPSVASPTRPGSKYRAERVPRDNSDAKEGKDDDSDREVKEEKPAPAAASKGPSMQWEGGSCAKDMATSMGESFFQQAKEAEAQHKGFDLSEAVLPPPSRRYAKAVQRHPEPPSSAERAERKPAVPRGLAGVRMAPPTPAAAIASEPLQVVGVRHGKGDDAKNERPRTNYVMEQPQQPVQVAVQPMPQQAPIVADNSFGDAARADEVIDSLLSNGDIVVSALSQRLATMKLLRQHWERGEMSAIADHLLMVITTAKHDHSLMNVVCDFFASVDLKSTRVNLDVCTLFLPMLNALLDEPTPKCVITSMKCTTVLCSAFGELIRQTRSMVVAGGVDISREDRRNKCNACVDELSRMREKLEVLRNRHKRNVMVRNSIDALLPLIASAI